MSTPLEGLVFLLGAAVSLTSSWMVVSRIERLGQRFRLSEAVIGLLAALTGDGPEITSAVTALVHHERSIGAGVVLGSNVFNLAALLGLGAVVAGTIVLHRRVIFFSGFVALWTAVSCVLGVFGVLPAGAALAMALVALVPYAFILGSPQHRLLGLPLPARWCAWLCGVVLEEEEEVLASHHSEGRSRNDLAVAVGALVLVIVASAAMEEAGSTLGARLGVPQIVVGGIVLAAVTSLPNAVSAVYLARRQRGVAVLSTALNSNSLNSVAGFLIPASIVGLTETPTARYVAGWYLVLTAVALGFALGDRALHRGIGWLIIAAYAVFAGSLVAASHPDTFTLSAAAGSGLAALLVIGAAAARRRAQRSVPRASNPEHGPPAQP